MTTPEAKLKTALRDGFNACFRHNHGVMTGAIGVALGQARGLPDRYFGIPGHFAWIEAKAGPGKKILSEISQIRQCRDLSLCGQRVFVLWCEDTDVPAQYRNVILYRIQGDSTSDEMAFTWESMRAQMFWNTIFAVRTNA